MTVIVMVSRHTGTHLHTLFVEIAAVVARTSVRFVHFLAIAALIALIREWISLFHGAS